MSPLFHTMCPQKAGLVYKQLSTLQTLLIKELFGCRDKGPRLQMKAPLSIHPIIKQDLQSFPFSNEGTKLRSD